MDRRVFLTRGAPFSLLTSFLMCNGLSSCVNWQPGQSKEPDDGRVLVLIQLDGGNDGLNTVIPLDQYKNLITVRKNILIPENKVLALNDSSFTGLHPALKALQSLYKDKQLSIVQGVGSPNPDLSHFKSIDTWHSGADTGNTVYTGWLGRYIDHDTGYEADKYNGDPPAIQIGHSLSKLLQGSHANSGTVVGNLDFFYELDLGNYNVMSDVANNPLSFIRRAAIESKDHLQKVKIAAGRQKNLSSLYPPQGNNMLADQLKTAARLIGGGLKTKIYIANLTGFDTHYNQVETGDATKGDHADLLAKLSAAIAAFNDDLFQMGKQDKVVTMVYSEFGRRIKSNSGYGTDHGTSAPVMLFGGKVKGGLIGQNPEIAAGLTADDNLPMQHDFRSVYASVLHGWFGVPQPVINTILQGNYPVINLFN